MEPIGGRTSLDLGGAFSLGEEENPETSSLPVVEIPTTGEWYDVVRLSEAIAMQETGMGTVAHSTGAPPRNNVCGIRRNGAFESYDSIEEALADCQAVLVNGYYGATIEQIAPYWTETEVDYWINNVNSFYYGK